MWLHFALLIRKSRIVAETLVKPCLPDCVKIVLLPTEHFELAHGANLVSQWLEPPNQGLTKRCDLFKQTGMPTVND